MILLVGIGGSLGAGARFYLGSLFNGKWGNYPLGTWLVNILGSLLLGVVVNFHAQGQLSDWHWMAAGAGFCGAFTTFSTFGQETVALLRAGRIGVASAYVFSSALISVLAAFLGYAW
ncbi:fluoride efflux transporter CrcB [Virgibacillus sediminis]|uniref:Fluoride-specific ion channel FluC n=1 Tax=Virgibacillus sediminis TaxID=202260 RepID=A0ABV7A9J4_9BACI